MSEEYWPKDGAGTGRGWGRGQRGAAPPRSGRGVAGAEAAPRETSLVGLYALYGALVDVHWNELPPEVKQALRREATDAGGTADAGSP